MPRARESDPAWDAWADYYDLTDTDRAPFVDFYCSLVGEHTCSLLDLGCGTGTITIPLARLMSRQNACDELRVVGVDESRRMLDMARRRHDGVTWIVGDMRSPPIDGPFDLVICSFSTFQCLLRDEDLASAFRAVRAVIAEDGTFAFDLYQPNLAYLHAAHRDFLARAVTDESGRTLEIREDTHYEPSTRILQIDWRLMDAAATEASPVASIRQMARQYFQDDVDRLLAESGFAIRERYGDLDRSPFTPSSKKQVLVCRPSASGDAR